MEEMVEFEVAGGRVAVVRVASKYTRPVLLDISWSFDVLTVSAPVPRTAEPFGSHLAFKHPGHLYTVLCLKDMGAICKKVRDNW